MSDPTTNHDPITARVEQLIDNETISRFAAFQSQPIEVSKAKGTVVDVIIKLARKVATLEQQAEIRDAQIKVMGNRLDALVSNAQDERQYVTLWMPRGDKQGAHRAISEGGPTFCGLTLGDGLTTKLHVGYVCEVCELATMGS